ncbi:hypothetical protein [Nostoc linckia]|uniref:hypothetical protein n=1 Tax=Nostoc linckia TaxID=92942 RepID=UPI0015D4D142|nr:hypothetical protein [Nostoc linckia]
MSEKKDKSHVGDAFVFSVCVIVLGGFALDIGATYMGASMIAIGAIIFLAVIFYNPEK